MERLINTEKLREILLGMSDFFDKKKLNKLELRFVVQEFLSSIEIFEEYDKRRALKMTLEKHQKI